MNVKDKFWQWFGEHEQTLFELEADQEAIFDQIAAELQIVDPDLTFELGPPEPRREFIVSAGGIERAFPAVISLVDSAPKFARWRVIAFRPRRPFPDLIELSGKSVNSLEAQFSLLDNGRKAGIYLFIPNFRDDDVVLKQIGYLLLDGALGEFDVETRLGLIRMLAPEAPTTTQRYPLAELPRQFDQLINRLEGRSEYIS